PRLIVGGKRVVHLYHPPTDEACPLLIVFDGRDYLRRARLPVIADNLVAAGRIRPIALAMVENGSQARMIEYACNEATVGFLMECVLPLAQKHLNLIDPARQPGAHGVLGASMGGLMALYAALRLPQVFGHVLSQSGAFRLGSDDTVVFPLLRYAPQPQVKIWLDVGRYEWLLPANRQLRDLLAQQGYDFSYREFNAGHNYPAWRDNVWRGLEWLFPAQAAASAEVQTHTDKQHENGRTT
ncbi:MAG: alpha/beta hydrolase-fold protein, partial [Anaerolineae bacterium]|nr:alpha/beta hydrolase-fold protein [Anaerolineae bacterium]